MVHMNIYISSLNLLSFWYINDSYNGKSYQRNKACQSQLLVPISVLDQLSIVQIAIM